MNTEELLLEAVITLELIRDSGVSENDPNKHCRHCNRFQSAIEDFPRKGDIYVPGHINPHDEWTSTTYPSLVPVCVRANEFLELPELKKWRNYE